MNYTAIKAKAEKAIRKAGKPVSLFKVDDNFDEIEGEVSDVQPQEFKGYAIEEAFENNLIDGTNVLRDDRKLTLVGTPKPEAGEKIVFGDASWKVISTKPFAPGPVTIYYEVQVRK